MAQKNIKKIFLLLFSVFSTVLIAQENTSKFYLGITYGSSFLNKPVNEFQKNRAVKYEVFSGYKLFENMYLELGINYFQNSFFGNEKGDYYYYRENTITKDIHMIQIKPTIVWTANYKKINPYFKVSAIIGNSAKVNYFKWSSDPNYEDALPSYTKFIKSGGVPFGVSNVLGIDFKITSNLKLFTEIESQSITYNPKNGYYELFYIYSMTSQGLENQFDYDFANGFLDLKKINQTYFDSYYAPSIFTKTSETIKTFNINFGVKYDF